MPQALVYARGVVTLPASQQRDQAHAHYRDHLAARGFDLGDVYEDQPSTAGTPLRSRPAGFQLTQWAERGDVALIASSSCAFAGVDDMVSSASVWAVRGVSVCLLDLGVCTLDAGGRACLEAVRRAFAMHRTWRGERIASSLRKRRAEGRVWNHAPTLYKAVDGHLVLDPEARREAQHLLAWRQQGWSEEQIYFHVLRHRVTRIRTGEPWSLAGIRRVILAEQRLQAQERKQKETVNDVT